MSSAITKATDFITISNIRMRFKPKSTLSFIHGLLSATTVINQRKFFSYHTYISDPSSSDDSMFYAFS